MAKKNRIVGGMTQLSYYTIPDDKDLIITSPHKEAIFTFLGQIGYDKFPEFIRDILVKAEKHTLIDITDGPGDEKQDILTLSPTGIRCLTQCKHSINISSHYAGDELDIMVSACLRKACRQAIFVTNTDLTPQAKKYVTDKEYLRGWPDNKNSLEIDYWNDGKIWDKIKNNSDILNKWFGSLGQTHGLRNFKLELAVQKLPFNKQHDFGWNVDLMLEKLLKDKKVKFNNDRYECQLIDGTSLFLHKWVLVPSNLNINYLIANDSGEFPNRPLAAIKVEVNLPYEHKYSPTLVRSIIIEFLLEEALEELPDSDWWHITASQSKSFIFLHDLGETRQITLDNAETFIKKDNKIVPELSYISLDPDEYNLQFVEDDDIKYVHKQTGIQVIQYFDQEINPYYLYEQQLIQIKNLEQIKTHTFKAVEGIESTHIMRVRKILDMQWPAIQYGDDTLIWGIPPGVEQNYIDFVENKLKNIGLVVLNVEEIDRDTILSNLQNDMPSPMFQMISDLNKLSFPVDLTSRTFWLLKELPISANVNDEKAVELLKFKFFYENMNGFDNMHGETIMNSHTSEIPNLLVDLFTIRGRKMLEIGIINKPYNIIVRFREALMEDSSTLSKKYLEEFTQLYSAIESFLISDTPINFDAFKSS